MSNRSLLANALEGAAQTDWEKQKLTEYKSQIQKIEAQEKKLREVEALAERNNNRNFVALGRVTPYPIKDPGERNKILLLFPQRIKLGKIEGFLS